MFVLNEKLKASKRAFKSWNKSQFGNIHDNVLLALKDVEDIQLLNQNSDPDLDAEIRA